MSYYRQKDPQFSIIALCVLLFTLLVMILSVNDATAADPKKFRGQPINIYTEKVPPSIYYRVKTQHCFNLKEMFGEDSEDCTYDYKQSEVDNQ